MKRPTTRTTLLLAGAATALGLTGYALGRWQSVANTPPAAAASGGKALYWYDPMRPEQHFDHPGKSPFMDMQLVPKMADAAPGASSATPGVQVDPAAIQSLGIRTAVATRGTLASTVTTTGTVDFNERNIAIVQPRAAGFVQRVYQRAPGDVVRAGAPIADLLVPEWGGAQDEFLAVRRTGDAVLISAARERLRLLGMSDWLIQSVERGERPRSIITVTTPVGGVIQKLDVRPGMTVAMGQSLAEVNSLASVWVTAAVPETQAGLVREGQKVSVSLTAFPTKTFPGRVQAVLPQVAGDSRTLQARIELPNPGEKLRPGMFATVAFAGGGQSALLIPSEAIITTGRRTLVMLAKAGGRFQPAEVSVGREADGQTEILAGLQEGERVVASGQFLLDSEASLSGLAVRPLDQVAASGMAAMQPPRPPRAMAAAAGLYQTQGRVESVSPTDITLSHQAVPALGWPAMTMTFHVVDPRLVKGVKTGEQVRFGFDQPAQGPTLRTLAPLGAGQ
jgi:Cu(I)/Ag(I) efflux system membrane fusion protein